MNLFYVLNLSVIFLLGSVTSYEDWKYGIIKNKWIIFGSVYGVLHCFYLFFSTDFLNYFIQFSISLVFVFIFSFLMWKYDLWGAGDAKLFSVFFASLSLAVFDGSSFNFLLPLKFLAYTFVSAFFYVSAYLLLFGFKKKNREKFLKNIKKNKYKRFLKNLSVSLAVLICINIFFVAIKKGDIFSVFDENYISALLQKGVLLFLLFRLTSWMLDFYSSIFPNKKLPFAPWIFLGLFLSLFSLQ
jgi:Flp pilus assembly protein protease CpaA